LLGTLGSDISSTEKPEKGSGGSSPFTVDCKAGSSKIEVWAGNKSSSSYSEISGSGDGFSTRIKIQKKDYTKGDKSIPGTEVKCSARYRFFRITEMCNGSLVTLGGDYGKIQNWKFTGPSDCADTGVTNWTACTGVRGIPSAQICVTTYYCPDPDCSVVNGNGDTVALTPNALKYDVKITGLQSSTCGDAAYFGIDVRGAVKSSLKIEKDKTHSDTDSTGARCPIDFSWATGIMVNGQMKAINFTSCDQCDNNHDEADKPESDEHNHCCNFGLTQGPSSTIFWDPTLSFSAAPAAYSVAIGFLVAVAAFLF